VRVDLSVTLPTESIVGHPILASSNAIIRKYVLQPESLQNKAGPFKFNVCDAFERHRILANYLIRPYRYYVSIRIGVNVAKRIKWLIWNFATITGNICEECSTLGTFRCSERHGANSSSTSPDGTAEAVILS
jgi:hypothetical protein